VIGIQQMKRILTLLILLLNGFWLFAQNGQQISETDCRDKPDSLDGHKVLIVVDEPPEYNGGMTEYYKLISKNLRYPKYQKEFQGSIYVKFLIDTLGNVRGECIEKRHNKETLTPIEIEALRLVKELDDWLPGKHKGRKVPVKYVLPIKF